jgi:hypothetical protein
MRGRLGHGLQGDHILFIHGKHSAYSVDGNTGLTVILSAAKDRCFLSRPERVPLLRSG